MTDMDIFEKQAPSAYITLRDGSAELIGFTFYSESDGFAKMLNQVARYSHPKENSYYPTQELRLLDRLRLSIPGIKIEITQPIPSNTDVIY